MKVFIATDMEGVSGVVHPEHTGWDGRRHQEARKWTTEHIDAAVGAAVEIGATEVVVCDGHSNGRNVILDMLHPEAKLMWGRRNRILGQMEGIDATFDAVLMVGFHARAGTLGVLNHTINSGVVTEVKVNGTPVGEVEIGAAIAGEFGVPVAIVSGDATAVAESKESMPHIETATTMEPVGTYSAKVLAPAKAHAVIREATVRALQRLPEMRLYKFERPVRVEVHFKDTAMADAATMMPGIDRSMPCAPAMKDVLPRGVPSAVGHDHHGDDGTLGTDGLERWSSNAKDSPRNFFWLRKGSSSAESSRRSATW